MHNDSSVMGRHIILDMRTATAGALKDPAEVERILRDAATATGATILSGHFHHFGPEQGVTGVLVLAESHISIHTWPEHYYTAIDIFVCGNCDPTKAIPALKFGFGAVDTEVLHTMRVIPITPPVLSPPALTPLPEYTGDGCCHRTRVVGFPCPEGRECPYDAAARRYISLFGKP